MSGNVLRNCLLASLLLATSLFPACDSGKKPVEEVVKLTPEEQKKLDEMKAEVELGRNMAGRLLQYYGTFGEEAVIGYVNQVGLYVSGHSDFIDRRYMFHVLDNDTVNAFACPGGYILITLGTLRNARSEAELAMVLGHEVAHVGHQHMFNTLRKMSDEERDKEAEAAEKAGQTPDLHLLVRERPDADEQSAAGKVLARYLSGSAGAAFSLLKAAKAGMTLILEKGLDKKLEFEADREGVKYAIRAGYEPVAMLSFLARLNKKKKKLNMAILEKTHPSIQDRATQIKRLLAAVDVKSIVGAKGEKRYLSQVKDLPPPKKGS